MQKKAVEMLSNVFYERSTIPVIIVLKHIKAEQDLHIGKSSPYTAHRGTSAFTLEVSPTSPFRKSYLKSSKNNPAMSAREIALRACDYSIIIHNAPCT
jgi:hypothetical protein